MPTATTLRRARTTAPSRATTLRPGLGARARALNGDAPAQGEAPRRSTLSCRLGQSILKTLERKYLFRKVGERASPGDEW